MAAVTAGKISKDDRSKLKAWANSKECGLFCKRIAEHIDIERVSATVAYNSKHPVELTNAVRADHASRSWAFDTVLGIIEEFQGK